MNVFRVFNSFSGLVLTFALASCVSVNFKPSAPEKSKTVVLQEPKSPFREITSAHIDRAWRDEKTGATISYLSDCGNPTDPSLQNIFKGITAEIDAVQVQESSTTQYNGREALHSKVDGKVDGVATRFEVMIFKKHVCIYIITYAATAAAFPSHQAEFAAFLKEFTVP